MSDMPSATSSSSSLLHPLLRQLIERHGATELDAGACESFAAQAGDTVLFFTEDPVRYRETLDVAVILPELARAAGGRFRIGVLAPPAARALAPRYGVQRWPALVFVREGRYVGAIEGICEWAEFHRATAELLAAAPRHVPVPVVAVGDGLHADSHHDHCH
jgi:hydrogenase-1 operon protein HyaE